MRLLRLFCACLLATSRPVVVVANELTPLTNHAAVLYQQAQGGKFFSDTAKLKPDILPTSDGQSFLAVWRATGPAAPKSWIVTLHGTQGFATDDLALWSRHLKDRKVGLICVQWWLGSGDTTSSYYTPQQIYREIDLTLKRLRGCKGDSTRRWRSGRQCAGRS